MSKKQVVNNGWFTTSHGTWEVYKWVSWSYRLHKYTTGYSWNWLRGKYHAM